MTEEILWYPSKMKNGLAVVLPMGRQTMKVVVDDLRAGVLAQCSFI